MSGLEIVGAIASSIAIIGALKKSQSFKKLRSKEIEEEWNALNIEIEDVAKLLEDCGSFYHGLDDLDKPPPESLKRAVIRVQQTIADLNQLSAKYSVVPGRAYEVDGRMRPKKTQWVFLKQEIPKLQTNLRDARISLSVASSQNISALLQQVQEGVVSLQIQLNAGTDVIRREIKASTLRRLEDHTAHDAETTATRRGVGHFGDNKSLGGSGQGLEMTAAAASSNKGPLARASGQFPNGCPKSCLCKCHRAKSWFTFKTPCTYQWCRGSNMTLKWSIRRSIPLSGQILACTMSLSTSLRPATAIDGTDCLWGWIIEPDFDFTAFQQRAQLFRPRDTNTRAHTLSLSYQALNWENIRVLEALLVAWEPILAENKFDRCTFYQANELLSVGGWSDHEIYVLRKVIEYSDDEAEEVPCQQTRLHDAVQSGQDVHETLKQEPWAIHVWNLHGQCPVHTAIEAHDDPLPILEDLRMAGAAIDEADARGWTPLMLAAHYGQVETARWLLDHGANVHYMISWLGSALERAIKSPEPSSCTIVEMLLGAGQQATAFNKDGKQPIHYFSVGGFDTYETKRRTIRLLMEAGAGLESRDKSGNSPLTCAIVDRNLPAIRVLLDLGADVHEMTSQKENALHLLARYGSADAIREFMNSGALRGLDLNRQDSLGDTPWDAFVRVLRLPGHFADYPMSEEKAEAFEELYRQTRDWTIQSDVEELEAILAALEQDGTGEAVAKLHAIAKRREPSEPSDLFATEATMKPYKSIILLMRKGDVNETRDAVEERIEELKRELDPSPWKTDSRWWNERPPVGVWPGPLVRDYEVQSEFAERVRKAALGRWQAALEESVKGNEGELGGDENDDGDGDSSVTLTNEKD